MKILLALPLAFSCSILHAQTLPVDTFFTPGATWTLGNKYSALSGSARVGSYGARRVQYRVEADTFIAGVKYHPLSIREGGGYRTSTYANSYTNPNEFEVDTAEHEYSRLGRIRIDGKKIFFAKDADSYNYCYLQGKEYLLYDFGLTPGDTFQVKNGCFTQTKTLAYIDSSAVLSNGLYIKRFVFNDMYEFDCLYGIGGMSGIVNYHMLTIGPGGAENSPYLLCYDHPSFSYRATYADTLFRYNLQYTCFDVSTIPIPTPLSPTDTLSVSLQYNPTYTDAVNLAGSGASKIRALHVFDLTGREIPFKPPYPGSPTYNALTGICPGIYILKIIRSDNSAYIQRFSRL